MIDKEVSEKEIDDILKEIMDTNEKFSIKITLRLLAKLIYNLRFDVQEFKTELLKVLKEDDYIEQEEKDFVHKLYL